MTYEEALDMTRIAMRTQARKNGKNIDLLLLINAALEKQIQKKPIRHSTNIPECDDIECPNCHQILFKTFDDEYVAFDCCDKCGQRLDWSEE